MPNALQAITVTLALAGSTAAVQAQQLKFVSSLPRTGSANAQTGTIVNGIP